MRGTNSAVTDPDNAYRWAKGAAIPGGGWPDLKISKPIPTPRWSTCDARTLGVPPRDDLPVAIQERAWTSPIWYEPG